MSHWIKWGSGSSHINHDFQHLVQTPDDEYRALYDGAHAEDEVLIVWVKKNYESNRVPYLVDLRHGGWVEIEQRDAEAFKEATTEEKILEMAEASPPE